MDKRHAIDTPAIDRATLALTGLTALLGLMATEEVATAFSQLDTLEQVAVFGALEDIARTARAAVGEPVEVSHG